MVGRGVSPGLWGGRELQEWETRMVFGEGEASGRRAAEVGGPGDLGGFGAALRGSVWPW